MNMKAQIAFAAIILVGASCAEAGSGPTYTVFVSPGSPDARLTVSSSGDAVLRYNSTLYRLRLSKGSVRGYGFTLEATKPALKLFFGKDGGDYLCEDCPSADLPLRWNAVASK